MYVIGKISLQKILYIIIEYRACVLVSKWMLSYFDQGPHGSTQGLVYKSILEGRFLWNNKKKYKYLLLQYNYMYVYLPKS